MHAPRTNPSEQPSGADIARFDRIFILVNKRPVQFKRSDGNWYQGVATTQLEYPFIRIEFETPGGETGHKDVHFEDIISQHGTPVIELAELAPGIPNELEYNGESDNRLDEQLQEIQRHGLRLADKLISKGFEHTDLYDSVERMVTLARAALRLADDQERGREAVTRFDESRAKIGELLAAMERTGRLDLVRMGVISDVRSRTGSISQIVNAECDENRMTRVVNVEELNKAIALRQSNKPVVSAGLSFDSVIEKLSRLSKRLISLFQELLAGFGRKQL